MLLEGARLGAPPRGEAACSRTSQRVGNGKETGAATVAGGFATIVPDRVTHRPIQPTPERTPDNALIGNDSKELDEPLLPVALAARFDAADLAPFRCAERCTFLSHRAAMAPHRS